MAVERFEVQRAIATDPATIPIMSEGALRATLGILARTLAPAGISKPE
jgi:hypothetical protein